MGVKAGTARKKKVLITGFARTTQPLAARASAPRCLHTSAVAARQRLYHYVLADLPAKSPCMQGSDDVEPQSSAEAPLRRTQRRRRRPAPGGHGGHKPRCVHRAELQLGRGRHDKDDACKHGRDEAAHQAGGLARHACRCSGAHPSTRRGLSLGGLALHRAGLH